MPARGIHIAFDDVTLSLIPDHAPVVVAYVDGDFVNYDPAVARFGAERVRGITVHGEHGPHIYWCDSERGDLSSAQTVAWVEHEVESLYHKDRGPYSAVSDMQGIVDQLAGIGVPRSSYPIWTAHYGAGAHICGPTTCGYPGFHAQADGTQFTDVALGRSLDESLVTVRWLGAAADPNAWPDVFVSYGDRGAIVKRVQERLITAHHWKIKADGVFGGQTLGAVQVFQRNHGLPADGIIGPVTWAKLF